MDEEVGRLSQKEPLPSAVCAECHRGFPSMDAHNKRCRCGGLISAAIGINDWEECAQCNTSGWTGTEQCMSCRGCGWVYVRRFYGGTEAIEKEGT